MFWLSEFIDNCKSLVDIISEIIYLFIITRFLHNIHQIEKILPFELTPETTFVEVQEGNSRKIELGDLSWVSG